MRWDVWREARRANRDEGYGTSMPGRIFGLALFLALIWCLALDDRFNVMELVICVTTTVAGLGILAFGLTEDYRDARDRLAEESDR